LTEHFSELGLRIRLSASHALNVIFIFIVLPFDTGYTARKPAIIWTRDLLSGFGGKSFGTDIADFRHDFSDLICQNFKIFIFVNHKFIKGFGNKFPTQKSPSLIFRLGL
jgi:hypothetical protein